MNRFFAAATLAIALASISQIRPGESRGSSGIDETDVESEIRAMETMLARAVVHPDRALYDRLLADDFTHTSHSGVFKTKAEWMAEDKFPDTPATRPGRTVYEAFEVDDLAVRVYRETAVVTGRSTPRGRDAKGQPIRGQYRFQRVWVKRQGRWQVVAFQGTRIAGT